MLFQRRRQIKVLIELFQKFTEREAGLANIAFKRVFEGVRGNFSQVKKVFPLKILFLYYIRKDFHTFLWIYTGKFVDNHFEKSANVDKVDNPKSYTDLSTQFSKPFFL